MTEIVGGPSREQPLLRPTARVVLLDPAGRILLFKVTEPERPQAAPFWITPGGGLEGDETFEECARRELREETGIEDVELGPCIWLREHTWRWGAAWIRSQERYFVARTEQTGVSNSYQTELEMQFLAEHRWWTLDEMRGAAERLVPAAFAELAGPLIAGAWPLEPITVGE
ncbi:MAG: NUDIX domain-containing protein [Dehalococcoidia bacterium]